MRYALVTGASRGIGRAVAVRLASGGIPVLLNYRSGDDAAMEVKEIIECAGGKAELMKFDVSCREDVETALNGWMQAHPDDYIAYLVNNAGIRRDNLMFMMPEDDWHSVLDTTLDGFFHVTKTLLPAMLQRKHGGSIVNMTSLSGLKGLPGQTNYSAAKAAIIGATKALAQETAPRGVRVNAIAPGFIATDMTKDLAVDELSQSVPMKRFGKPEEVAELAYFLISDASSYITGEVISINGGML